MVKITFGKNTNYPSISLSVRDYHEYISPDSISLKGLMLDYFPLGIKPVKIKGAEFTARGWEISGVTNITFQALSQRVDNELEDRLEQLKTIYIYEKKSCRYCFYRRSIKAKIPQ